MKKEISRRKNISVCSSNWDIRVLHSTYVTKNVLYMLTADVREITVMKRQIICTIKKKKTVTYVRRMDVEFRYTYCTGR